MKIFCLLILLSFGHVRSSRSHTYNKDAKGNITVNGPEHSNETHGSVHSNETHGSEHSNETHGSEHSNETHGSEHSNETHVHVHLVSIRWEEVKSPLMITVFLLAAGICKLGFHQADFLSSRVPESCLLIILGIIVGAILRDIVTDVNDMPGMSSSLFFLYLLPPIILESAWSLHDRTFFDNVGTVLIYAVIGTVLNCFIIGPTLYGLASSGAMGDININFIQCLVFSAIIVAVDPVAVLAIFQEIGVNNVLYFLVFGESLLNDAVTVVLYNLMNTFNSMSVIPVGQVFLGVLSFFIVSFGGIALGLIFGMMTAFITKYTTHVRVIEPLSVFVLAYMSYLMAELFHFSGIISIIVCGLTQAQYAFHNISAKSHTTVKYFSKMQSSISDCIIFVFLGIAMFKEEMFKSENWHAWFIIWTLVLCLFYRFIVVFMLTYIINKSNRVRRIGKEEQFIMAYGGLRGAVAFSLVDLLQKDSLPKEMFMTTLMVLIFFTVFVQGISIKPLVKILRVKLQNTDKITIGEEINAHVTDHVMAGIEEVLGRRGEHHFREILEFYNSKYLKHWLQKNPITTDEHIMSLYEKIALQQHFENLAGSRMIQDKYVSDENFPLIPEEVRRSIIHEEEEPESEDEGSEEDTVLPPITVTVPPIPMPRRDSEMPTPLPSPTVLPLMQPEMLDDWIDQKLAQQREDDRIATDKVGRRRSLFPFRRKDSAYPRADRKPTALDVRKLMAPSRRDVVHKKLDKNLKNDSSADLLKFLQEKQIRTRRMSRAVLGGGTSTPAGSQQNIYMSPRRTSVVNANTAAQNYKRRLSLAVPERPRFYRDRSPSDITGLNVDNNLFRGVGDASKSPDSSPGRRRRQFRKAKTLNFEPETSPLINENTAPPRSPYKTSINPTSKSFDVIHEHEEAEEESEELDTSKSSAASDISKKRKSRFKKSKSVSEDARSDSSSIKRSQTDPSSDAKSPTKVKFDVKSEITPKKRKKKGFFKSKSLDHSRSSGEFSDETGSHISGSGSVKSDSQSSVKSDPDTENVELKPLSDSDHAARKSSYTQAMSNIIPDDSDTVELKDFEKDNKSLKKQKSL